MPDTLENPQQIADRAMAIYDSQYRQEYEKQHLGKFVAINIRDGSVVLGDSGSETLLNAKHDNPDGLFHLIRVGHPAAFEVGLAYKNANPDRVHR